MALIVFIFFCVVVLDLILLQWRKIKSSAPATAEASPPDSDTETIETAESGATIETTESSASDETIETTETSATIESAAAPSPAISSASASAQVEVHAAIGDANNRGSNASAAIGDANNTGSNASAGELPSIQSSSSQVSAARTLSFQGRRIRKKWSKSKTGRNLIALFGQKKGTRFDEKEDLIKDKRELRADLLEKRRRHVRELRWAKNSDENGSFFDKYMLLKPIGKGGFGAVYEAKLKRNSSFGPFAVKIVSKSRTSTAGNEIRFLKKLHGNNANVVKYYEAHEDSDKIFIVTELCKGGNLYERLESSGGKFGESEAKRWMAQALNAVTFCHSRGIVHRDIKPENFMCMSHQMNCKIKLIDFGLSACLLPGGRLSDMVGTTPYMAPEVFGQCSGYESEAWSLGIMAYELLVGECPFKTGVTSEGLAYVKYRISPDFSRPAWRSISAEARDFIEKLLVLDPARRMTVHDAQRHKWITSSIAHVGPAGQIRRNVRSTSNSGPRRHAGPTAPTSRRPPLPPRPVLQVRHAGPTAAIAGPSHHARPTAANAGPSQHVGPTSRRPPPLAVLQDRLADLQNVYMTNFAKYNRAYLASRQSLKIEEQYLCLTSLIVSSASFSSLILLFLCFQLLHFFYYYCYYHYFYCVFIISCFVSLIITFVL